MVEHYEKGEIRELEPDYSPFDQELCADSIVMKVKPGSKLHSLVGYAEKQLQEDKCRHVIFAGVGPACTKTISAVEVLKRRLRFDLHQITRSKFKRVEEYWDPKVDGLERLKVNRDIPAIYVLLSKDVLPTDDPGYQGPGRDIPLLRSDKPSSSARRQAKTGGAASSSKDSNRWKRHPKGGGGGGKEKKATTVPKRPDDTKSSNQPMDE